AIGGFPDAARRRANVVDVPVARLADDRAHAIALGADEAVREVGDVDALDEGGVGAAGGLGDRGRRSERDGEEHAEEWRNAMVQEHGGRGWRAEAYGLSRSDGQRRWRSVSPGGYDTRLRALALCGVMRGGRSYTFRVDQRDKERKRRLAIREDPSTLYPASSSALLSD